MGMMLEEANVVHDAIWREKEREQNTLDWEREDIYSFDGCRSVPARKQYVLPGGGVQYGGMNYPAPLYLPQKVRSPLLHFSSEET